MLILTFRHWVYVIVLFLCVDCDSVSLSFSYVKTYWVWKERGQVMEGAGGAEEGMNRT